MERIALRKGFFYQFAFKWREQFKDTLVIWEYCASIPFYCPIQEDADNDPKS